jgi:hypothetical protein
VDAGARRDSILHESAESGGGGVVDDLHPQPAGACAADLDGHDDKRLGAALASATEPVLEAAHEALIDLDGSGRMQPLAASNRRFSTGLTETRLTGHPLDARPCLGHCSPAPTPTPLPEG